MSARILNRPDLETARMRFVEACSLSLAHASAAASALAEFGDHGPLISGCVRDHFPDDVKDHLRGLARDCSAASEAGYAARPARVRMATMRALARAVADDVGFGFYGPQGGKS